jgi:hypothetical protein
MREWRALFEGFGSSAPLIVKKHLLSCCGRSPIDLGAPGLFGSMTISRWHSCHFPARLTQLPRSE